MQEAKRQLFWANDTKFGIRMGHNLSYLDTLCYIGNTNTTLMMDFKFNSIPEGTSYCYVFATGSRSWYSVEYNRVSAIKYFYMNIGTTTSIEIPTVIPYEFNRRLQLTITTGNGEFNIVENYTKNGSYSGTII